MKSCWEGPNNHAEDLTMYHTIEFNVDFVLDLEISPRQPLERVLIHKGTRFQAQLKPMVEESVHGPVEVADLFFVDGSTTRRVPFEYFQFVE